MIYFLRHQKTVNNKLGKISGQADSPILCENIYIENSCIIKQLDSIYSSPSQRCLDTLQCIPNFTIIPNIDKRLLERKMGDFENFSRKELYEKYPEYFENIDGNIRFRFKLTPPNGESFSEFKERISSFCKEEILPNKNRNILICSHNQAMKMMYFVLAGIQPSEKTWKNINFPNGKIVNYIIHSKNIQLNNFLK